MTLNDWRNAKGELLHSDNIAFATGYINDEGISNVGTILNNPENALIISTDADIANLLDHRSLWVRYTVSRGRDTQRLVKNGEKQKDYNCSKLN